MSGGAGAVRTRLVRAPEGANPVPGALAVVFALIGGWLVLTATALPRLDLDRIEAVAAGPQGAAGAGGAGPARSVAILTLEPAPSPPESRPSALSAAPSPRATVPVRVSGIEAAPGASCAWLPAQSVGRSSVQSGRCVALAEGQEIRAADLSRSQVVVDETSAVTVYESSYILQGIFVLGLGALCGVIYCVFVWRDRRMVRRYRDYVDGLIAVPLPGIDR